MEHKLLKKEKMDKIFHSLLEKGYVECGNEAVDDFIKGLGEILHHSKQFSQVRCQLKDNVCFRQRFDEELRKVILEG